MANRFERGKLPPYTIPTSFDRLGTRIIGINEIVGGEAAPAYKVPVGSLIWDYSLTQKTSADNLLSIDGSAISRSTYASLFGVLSVTYGVGDGTTTFNLPNAIELYSRVLGPTTDVRGAYSRAILPQHQHNITTPAQGTANALTQVSPGTSFQQTGGFNTLTPNTGSTSPTFRSALHPSYGVRLTAYITTEVYNLKPGQIIYGLSDQVLNEVEGKFLKCNATTFSAGTYSALADALGAITTPDLRGYFPVIRSYTGANRSQGVSPMLPTHTHSSPTAFTMLKRRSIFTPPAVGPGEDASPVGPTTVLLQARNVYSSPYVLGPGLDDKPANVALDFLICAI